MCLCMKTKTEHFYFPALGYSPVSENKLFGFLVRHLLSRLVNALFRSSWAWWWWMTIPQNFRGPYKRKAAQQKPLRTTWGQNLNKFSQPGARRNKTNNLFPGRPDRLDPTDSTRHDHYVNRQGKRQKAKGKGKRPTPKGKAEGKGKRSTQKGKGKGKGSRPRRM